MHRRDLAVLLAASAVCAPPLASPSRASPLPVVRVGVLRFGTASWELSTIARHGLAAAAGVRVEALEFASNEATRVALQARTVDVIVSDWLFASRQRSEGQPLCFAPFSSAVAALVVHSRSTPAYLGDLRGRRVGVSGGPLDKAWLLLVAEARRRGIDLTKDAEPVFGASPLLAEKLARAELDAALLYWNFAARLEAEGHRELLAMEAVEAALGATAPVAMLGHVFDERWAAANRPAVDVFLRAAAKAILRDSDAEWDALRPLLRVRVPASSRPRERRRTREEAGRLLATRDGRHLRTPGISRREPRRGQAPSSLSLGTASIPTGAGPTTRSRAASGHGREDACARRKHPLAALREADAGRTSRHSAGAASR